jgi:hypothetical protein
MLWYRLHDMGLVAHLNRAMLMALHFHLARATPSRHAHSRIAGSRLLKLLVPEQCSPGRQGDGVGGGSGEGSADRLPCVTEYGLCRGTLGGEIERLQVRHARPHEMAAADSRKLRSAAAPVGCANLTAGKGGENAHGQAGGDEVAVVASQGGAEAGEVAARAEELAVEQAPHTEWLYFRTDNGTEFHVDFSASQYGLFDYIQALPRPRGIRPYAQVPVFAHLFRPVSTWASPSPARLHVYGPHKTHDALLESYQGLTWPYSGRIEALRNLRSLLMVVGALWIEPWLAKGARYGSSALGEGAMDRALERPGRAL